jgi:hypothetical protein
MQLLDDDGCEAEPGAGSPLTVVGVNGSDRRSELVFLCSRNRIRTRVATLKWVASHVHDIRFR